MQRTIALISTTVALVGWVPVAFAQSNSQSTSPAELLGVQERSIQNPSKSSRVISLDSSEAVSSPAQKQILLYQLDPNTRVVVGPADGNAQSAGFPSSTQSGDNRLQLLHDLDE